MEKLMKNTIRFAAFAAAIAAFAPAVIAADIPSVPATKQTMDQPTTGKDVVCTVVDGPKCFVDLHTGIHMAYVEVGPKDGKTLILLHGLTDTARSWAPVMAALHAADPSLHIYALDQRGHGGSSMPAGPACVASPKTFLL
jgi:alpha-beta hydrolase superfamily lysophospholipase